jgi:peroxiredoxin
LYREILNGFEEIFVGFCWNLKEGMEEKLVLLDDASGDFYKFGLELRFFFGEIQKLS